MRLPSPSCWSRSQPAATVGLAGVGGSTAMTALTDGVTCDLSQYTASAGLRAANEQDLLVVTWSGQGGSELRSRFAIDGGQPTIRDLAIRKTGGRWLTIGENLTPDYRVVSGVRRLPSDQGNALRSLGVKVTRETIDQNRWQAFWDAPLRVPGTPEPGRGSAAPPAAALAPGEIPLTGRVYELPRKPEEIRRASATFKTTSCTVRSEGASLEVTPTPASRWASSPATSASRSIADLYANFPVNYLKIDRVPAWREDWTPILKALRGGNFFVTTGEILIRNYSVTGSGSMRTLAADVEWTYPPSFMEIVMGDGRNVTRQRVSLRDLPAFGSKRITQSVNTAGMAWVRLSIWDVATNGAFVQPVWLTSNRTDTKDER